MDYAIGIDLGGSSVKAVAITSAGEILQRVNQEFDAGEKLDFADTIKSVFEKIQEKQGATTSFCGVAAPGLASKDHFSIAHMPGRLHGLEGLNWTEFLGTKAKVPVLNDAHAALLGEAWLGAAKGMEDVIMLTLGTGVGGAAIVDGRLLQGHIGRAGHLGHNCLNMDAPKDVTGIPGSIEYFVGNWNIRDRTGGRFATTHALVDAFTRGDPYAIHIWINSMRALAATVATYINVLDPEAAIIGGGIARAGKALFDSLEEALRPIEWQPGGHKVK
ncbi:MAG: ROK family protein, partial [Candidatus Binatia bacterium]